MVKHRFREIRQTEILIVGEGTRQLCSNLAHHGFNCTIANNADDALDHLAELTPKATLISINGSHPDAFIWRLPRRIKELSHLPVIAILSKESLSDLLSASCIDDFVVEPWEYAELLVRINRLLQQKVDVNSNEIVKCDDLLIDLGKCEVTIGSKIVALTFKEYELLRFLASNKGRVFSRDTLLDEIWGYDYYGGDRTVDVHIRRLRSKIEDPDHTFIETVRNIGYRFKKEA